MKRWLLIVTGVLLLTGTFAANPPMDACVDSMDVTYTLSEKGKARIFTRATVTVFSKAGSDAGLLNIFIGNNASLKYFKAEIFDSQNRKVKDVYQPDLVITSGYDQSTLYADTRILSYQFQSKSYPFHFDYSYEIQEDPFIAGLWQVVDQYNLSIRKAVLQVISPPDYVYSWRQLNIPEEPVTRQEGKKIIRTWSVGEYHALRKEPFSPPLITLQPSVFITPGSFTFEGYTCRNDSWKTAGSWVSALLEKRQTLSKDLQIKLGNMIAGATSDGEKARRIYDYFRSTTRYISIQEGIGSFQPVNASEVEKRGYGDCKGLVNYLKALYEAVGLPAIYTEIGNGNTCGIYWKDFPNEYCTNHVILMLPVQKDTIWIECTNPAMPFGYPGLSNLDRYALAVLPGKGVIVKTPDFGFKRNIQEFFAKLSVFADGSMHLNGRYRIDGIMMEDWIPLMALNAKDKQDRYIEKTEIPGLRVKKLILEESGRIVPDLSVEIDAECTDFMNINAGRISRKLHFMNQINLPKLAGTRQNPVFFPQSFQQIDSIQMEIDTAIRVEFIPPAVNLQSQFGSYVSECRHDKGHLIIYRKFRLNKGTYPKEDYPELLNFFESIRQADHQMLVLKKI